ncbi:DUF317 domain-containing protein [Streptomyces iconiensis]|uniref:DUF317 domain-containing protein n=1 Tax=Streptomyces iconiensis TaxID=1384038 RepID=A0ABT7A4J0_9ACTN|nr:DUF317 domain-containing protein [Streptomyces iconiensis]MDJ1136244.1 DUF317 domain-containing protein [Streptomyces iconiensis]
MPLNNPVKRPTWTARFTGHTPQPLMTAVASAVLDSSPVPREAYRVPERHRALVTLQPATAEHSARAAAAQARSRPSAVRPHATQSPQPPAPAVTPPRPTRKR